MNDKLNFLISHLQTLALNSNFYWASDYKSCELHLADHFPSVEWWRRVWLSSESSRQKYSPSLLRPSPKVTYLSRTLALFYRSLWCGIAFTQKSHRPSRGGRTSQSSNTHNAREPVSVPVTHTKREEGGRPSFVSGGAGRGVTGAGLPIVGAVLRWGSGPQPRPPRHALPPRPPSEREESHVHHVRHRAARHLQALGRSQATQQEPPPLQQVAPSPAAPAAAGSVAVAAGFSGRRRRRTRPAAQCRQLAT